MKERDLEAEEKAVRSEAEGLRDGQGRVCGDAAFKERVVRHVAARRKAGASLDAIEAAIGIPKSSLLRWTSSPKGSPRLARVRLSAAAPKKAASLVVHGPAGLRIEGLSVSELAELWAKLS